MATTCELVFRARLVRRSGAAAAQRCPSTCPLSHEIPANQRLNPARQAGDHSPGTACGNVARPPWAIASRRPGDLVCVARPAGVVSGASPLPTDVLMTTTRLLPDIGIELREGYAQIGDAPRYDSPRRKPKQSFARSRPRRWSSGGNAIPTSAPNWPSLTATTYRISTAWSACLRRRTGSITTRLNASTNYSSTSSPPRHRH
jgi:hypothetical protein